MSTQVLRFGTFNVGCGWADLQTMAFSASAETTELNKAISGCQNAAEQKARKQLFQYNIETSVANRLADQLDVISLQEITDEQRPFMNRLRERGFNVYLAPSRHTDYIYDCAIAVRSGLFQDVQNISILSESYPDNLRVYGQAIGAIVVKVNDG
jgi:hypothetical protein